MSPVMELSSSQDGHEDGNNERLDMIYNMDLSAPSLSLPTGTFLKAAVSLKDQVCVWSGLG